MRRCITLGRATFALIFAATSYGVAEAAEAQYLNATRSHHEARPGLSIPPSIVQHTTTTITEPGHLSTTALQPASTTQHAFRGCSTDCTFDDTYMTQNRNSWTKCQGTVMLGRVHYFVDSANNKTSTSTDFVQRVTFMKNGTEVTSDASDIISGGSHVLTRTDVNAAGTVTYMDGTNTMAYPTGFNVLPSFYVWNGTLPYTTNGSTACAKASDTTTTLRTTNTWTESRSSSVIATHTYSITRDVVGATPIPSVDNLPTHSVYNVDEQDPKGWTYCYAFGADSGLRDNFYSLFSGTLFEQVRLNCTRKGMAVSPLVVVDAAAFLLDETTSYINNPKTEHSDILRSRTTESSQTPTDVLVDPFQPVTKSSSVQKSAPSDEADSNTSAPTKIAQSILPDTASQASSDQPASDKQPVQTTAPSSKLKEPSATAIATKSAAQENEVVDNASQQSSPASPSVQSGTELSITIPATATSSGIQVDVLNSLIHDIGKLQSSSNGGIVANPAGSSIETVPSPSDATVAATTPVLPTHIIIGTSTATLNSDGDYMIGTHALQPTDSPYELQGTTYALDPSRSALIVNGISTYAVAPAAQHASDVPQAATLTINGVTATANSASNYVVETQTLRPGGPAITVSGTRISLASDAAAVVVGSQTSVFSGAKGTYAADPAPQHTDANTERATLTINGVTVTANPASNYVFETQTLKPGGPAITVSGTRISLAPDAAAVVVGSQTSALSTTMGIGDYVWAGLAGMLSAASDTANLPSRSTVSETSQTPSTQDGSFLPSTTSTASDSETVLDGSSASLSAATSSSTSSSNTNNISQQQIAPSNTGSSPTFQATPNVPSSRPSSSPSSSSIETSSENNSGRVALGASLAMCVLSLVVAVFAWLELGF